MPLTYSSLSSSPSPLSSSTSPPSSGNKLSPPLVFTIVTLSCVVFISGLILFLYRFLKRYRPSLPMSQSNRNPDMSTSDALQRQLQQLFHLHDSGLDQAFIDSLPMFVYKDIKGQKEPFDCAVCLCEFSEQDKLRLLPLCGHAFHIDCIDTWLLSNSTCPLCRGLLSTPGFSIENLAGFDLDDSRYEDGLSGNASIAITSDHQKPAEDDHHHNVVTAKRVFSVRLGKFVRTTNDSGDQGDDQMIKEVGETSHEMINLDARRCYSMGSFQYVVASSDLEVATLCPSTARSCNGVENGGDVRLQMRDGNSTANSLTNDHGDVNGKKISMRTKGESFSISKIWLWSKKDRLSSATNSHISSSVNVRLPRFSPNGDNKQ